MAELITLARPYAKAAFENALADSALSAWSEALRLLAAVSADVQIGAMFASPKLTAQQKSDVVVEVCGDALDGKQKNFVAILADNDRLPLLEHISELFELYKANQEKSIEVNVETAFDLSSEQLAALEVSLKKTLAREVEFNTSVNKELLGGVFIRAGDTVIDASIRGRLNKLAGVMSA